MPRSSGRSFPTRSANILIASVISTPAALAVAALMVPFRPRSRRPTARLVDRTTRLSSAMDAIAKGTGDGIVFLANIVAMLIVLVALVSLVNMVLGVLPPWAARRSRCSASSPTSSGR